MAAPSRRSAEETAAPARRKASVRLAGAHDPATPSPASLLQDAVNDQWREAARRSAEPAKWSRRRTAAFITVTCGGFWALVTLGVTRLAG